LKSKSFKPLLPRQFPKISASFSGEILKSKAGIEFNETSDSQLLRFLDFVHEFWVSRLCSGMWLKWSLSPISQGREDYSSSPSPSSDDVT